MNRRNFLICTGIFSATTSVGIFYYINRPEFGKIPQGERLKKILSSPHFVGDHFENLVPVQIMNENNGENRVVATLKFLFGDKKNYPSGKSRWDFFC